MQEKDDKDSAQGSFINDTYVLRGSHDTIHLANDVRSLSTSVSLSRSLFLSAAASSFSSEACYSLIRSLNRKNQNFLKLHP